MISFIVRAIVWIKGEHKKIKRFMARPSSLTAEFSRKPILPVFVRCAELSGWSDLFKLFGCLNARRMVSVDALSDFASDSTGISAGRPTDRHISDQTVDLANPN